MSKYAFHHSGQYIPRRKEELADQLAHHYVHRDIKERGISLGDFPEIHRLYRGSNGRKIPLKLESSEQAIKALKRALSKKSRGVLVHIYRDELIEPALQGEAFPTTDKFCPSEKYEFELFPR